MARRLFFLLVCLSTILNAQEASNQSPLSNYLEEPIPQRLFDQTDWEQAKAGIEYIDNVRNDPRKDKALPDTLGKDDTPILRKNRSTKAGSPIFKQLIYLLLILGAIGTVVVIISQFLRGDNIKFRKKRKIDGSALNFDIEVVEEKLIESDLDRMIREAEEVGNFPMALRLQYLASVKSLATSRHIKWKKAKTNRQYYREINHQKLKAQFRNNTLIYERIWYGDAEITDSVYNDLKPIFKNFTFEVNRNNLADKNTIDG